MALYSCVGRDVQKTRPEESPALEFMCTRWCPLVSIGVHRLITHVLLEVIYIDLLRFRGD